MQNTEAQQLMLTIIERAESGQFTEFRLITSWAEFRFYRKNARATRLVIKALKASANNLFKEYCRDVTKGRQTVDKILAYTQILDIAAFYEKELDTVKRMLDEYDEYLGKGHFWYSFLGGERDIWN